jgi:hypothetical protein
LVREIGAALYIQQVWMKWWTLTYWLSYQGKEIRSSKKERKRWMFPLPLGKEEA